MFKKISNVVLHKQLKSTTYDKLHDFQVTGTHDCKVVRIYDGDTFYAAIKVKNKCYRLKCRICDIDAPEIPMSHAECSSPEAIKGYYARDKLVELLTNVECSKMKSKKCDVLPSLSDQELQKLIDKENTLILRKALHIHGTDKYGRYLVNIISKHGYDVGSELLNCGLAKCY